MTKDRGYVQVYTGKGKGKTTAAIGLSIRALGAGKKILFLQFMKDKAYSEHKILPDMSENLDLKTFGKPFFVAREGDIDPEITKEWGEEVVFFPPGEPPQKYIDLVKEGIDMAREEAEKGEYDLIILDEINVALFYGLAKLEDVFDIIDNKAEHVEIVLTGRNAPEDLMKKADLVTEMREIKHYFEQGVMARKGIES